ncbi:hypothetical protein GCM10009560_35390 [Nonomuraea longicatena]|uniref:Uncharacterized protein n=1 Tax=Nonomuraea longicatena TaxID=83682 RepID=A0ABN1PNF6_9ACTN
MPTTNTHAVSTAKEATRRGAENRGDWGAEGVVSVVMDETLMSHIDVKVKGLRRA